jgi:hypothetical protein
MYINTGRGGGDFMSMSFSFGELLTARRRMAHSPMGIQGLLLLPIQELETLSVDDDWKCSSRLRLRWSR